MSGILASLTVPADPNLLVGTETHDDAAVYRLNPQTALVATVDFITPPVDDPYWFGQIAAANSISDIYSMGGRPILALNVVMFPSKQLDLGILKEILRGGNDKVIEAGAVMAGGHSVDDEEPKYGLCVNGIVDPERLVLNAGARAGDVLILTKPIGTGVLFNAVRSGKMAYAELEREVLPTVASLNRVAIETALEFDLHACTDITGFGIAGHALEMAKGSSCRINLSYGSLPVYGGALDMYDKGETTGSNKANREVVEGFLSLKRSLPPTHEELLFDPQTSGGLLLAVPADQADRLLALLQQRGVVHACKIGTVEPGRPEIVVA